MISSAISKDFPDYLKGKNTIIIDKNPNPKPFGKKCYPDLKVGVSEDLPDYFRNDS